VRICNPAIKNGSGAILEPTEWQRMGNQIDAAFIFTGSDLRKRDWPFVYDDHHGENAF
jgi:hypothetical protein